MPQCADVFLSFEYMMETFSQTFLTLIEGAAVAIDLMSQGSSEEKNSYCLFVFVKLLIKQ